MKFFYNVSLYALALSFLLVMGSGNANADVYFGNQGFLARKLAIVTKNKEGLWIKVRDIKGHIRPSAFARYTIDSFRLNDNEYVGVCDSFFPRILFILQEVVLDGATYLLDEEEPNIVRSKDDNLVDVSYSKVSTEQQLVSRRIGGGIAALRAKVAEVYSEEEAFAMEQAVLAVVTPSGCDNDKG